MTETGPHFTTWRPLQHEPFRDPEAIWYPAVQVDRFVAAQEEEIAKLQEQVRFGRERIDFHLNRAERAEKEIAGLQKQLEPLDLYRKVLPIVLQKRDAARKELAETLHALHHHDDCNAVKAARAENADLRRRLDEAEAQLVSSKSREWPDGFAFLEKERNAARARAGELRLSLKTVTDFIEEIAREAELHGWASVKERERVLGMIDSSRHALERVT